MAYTTSRVTYNFTSYTATNTGLYVFTGSCDGGYSVNIGGTSSVLYINKISAGTVAFIWAESGQTITCSSASFGQLVYVDGFTIPPYVSLKDQQTTTATTEGLANKVYIGAITGYSHYSPSSLNYSFTCSGASITTVAHPNPGWSRNAMSLIIPNNDATITVTCNSSEQKQAYIFEVQDLVEIRPAGTGDVVQIVNDDTRTLIANANDGYLFDYYELDDFVLLDYIESSGTQYIDTGIVYSSDLIDVKLDFSSTDTPDSTYKTLLGMYTQSSNPAPPFSIWQYNGYGNVFRNINTSTDYPYAFDGTRTQITFSNQNKTGSAYNIFLMKANQKGGNAFNGLDELKTYGAEIKVNNVLVRKYIPVKRLSTSEVGLLDFVEMKLYRNNGTGVFTYGTELGSIKIYDNPLNINLSLPSKIIANFISNYNIVLDYDENLGNATYVWVSGTQIELVATPNSNGQFKGWYINSIPISTNATYVYTVLSDVTIEARFERVWSITDSVSGNGAIQYTRGTDKNDVTFSVISQPNNHFVKYVLFGVDTETAQLIAQNNDLIITQNGDNVEVVIPAQSESTTTPLTLHLVRDITIQAVFEENDRYHITVKSDFSYGSFYLSDNDVFEGTVVTIWARPFPDYNFVKWGDGELSNPRQITVDSDITLVAEYQRTFETNGIYQYRCYIKDQLDLEAPPKAFMVAKTFDVKPDLMAKSNSNVVVLEMPTNVNIGDVLVLYDPFGNTLYQGVIKSIDGNKINCSQMQSFYKGLWIYNVSPQDFLEHEIAVLLQDYADGKIYKSTYVDTLVAQRLGGITIDYVGSTAVNLPTDLDDKDVEKMTQKDMEQFIYELYENYGIIFDFEINMAGTNYVHIKVPSYEKIKVGNNMYAISNMSPITTIEETNRLIVFDSKKVYRTTYVATKTGIVEEPVLTTNRFDITNTKVVFSEDEIQDLIANNLPEQMYNHKLTFTLLIKNFVYEFGDFNLGGELDVWVGDDYYNTVLTGYEIKKSVNQNITQVDFTCGKVRTALTKMLTMKGGL